MHLFAFAIVYIRIVSNRKTTSQPKSRVTASPVPSITDPLVGKAFDAFPDRARKRLMEMRALIYKTAAGSEGVGVLAEELKWGQPSYLTPETKSGTTIRLGTLKGHPEHVALFVHCQTNLIPRMRREHRADFQFSGKRALLVPLAGKLPREELMDCMRMALLYHSDRS